MIKTLFLICLALIVIVLILVILVLRIISLAQKPPENNPQQYKKNRLTKDNRKTIVFIGDSITHGRVSYNYVDLIKNILDAKKYNFVNAGRNSELAFNVLERIQEIIDCKPDIVTILIGGNDAKGSYSIENQKRTIKRKNLPEPPSKSFFRENLREIIKRLQQETTARIAVLSLPTIGEDLGHSLFNWSREFSKIIYEISLEEGVAYLPLFEKMEAYLVENNVSRAINEEKCLSEMYHAIFRHYFLGMSFERISKLYNYHLHADFLHLNKQGAQIVADLIADFVIDTKQYSSRIRGSFVGIS